MRNNLKWFFRQEFCKPKDFLYVDLKHIKQGLKNNPWKVFVGFPILVILGIVLMILYYLTLPFRLLNEIAQSWCEL